MCLLLVRFFKNAIIPSYRQCTSLRSGTRCLSKMNLYQSLYKITNSIKKFVKNARVILITSLLSHKKQVSTKMSQGLGSFRLTNDLTFKREQQYCREE